MKESCASANARDEAIAFITTPAIREILEARERGTNGDGFIWDGEQIASRPGYVTTDIPSATMVAGDWSELILALWGTGLEFSINPYATFPARIVGARVLVSCDVGIWHLGAFCISTVIT